MGTGEQRQVAVIRRHGSDSIDHLTPCRQQHGFTGGAEHQGVREVIDIFGCAGEMDKFRHRVQGWHGFGFFFEEILHRFHIVVGGALNLFDPHCVFFAEIRDNCIQVSDCVIIKSRNFGDVCTRRQFL